jgi:hypothetical protein
LSQSIKKVIRPLNHFFLNIGFNPRHIFSSVAYFLRHYPKYQTQYKEFQRLGGVITDKYAIFSDYDKQAGSASGHYFHQDLLVASYINKNNPTRHIDIGSRIDGFIAHVASFRKIDVMDVRDLNISGHSNISFIKADLMNKDSTQNNITDSISCLYAIEHFGLGRYGDPLDPEGHIKGFNNILRMLKPDGTLFISFPIGKNNEFLTHREYSIQKIFLFGLKTKIV